MRSGTATGASLTIYADSIIDRASFERGVVRVGEYGTQRFAYVDRVAELFVQDRADGGIDRGIDALGQRRGASSRRQ